MAVLSAALLILVIAGCDKSASAPPASSPGAAGAGGAAGKIASVDAAESAKVGAALECINRHSNRAAEVHDAYLGSVDPATGAAPAGRKPALLGLHGVEPCQRKVKEAVAMTPALPALDQTLTGYVAALVALGAAWEQLDGYYKKGEDADDKEGKQLATLHPRVVSAFDAFDAADRALGDVVGTMNRQRHEAYLAAREQAEGRNLEVLVGWMMLEGETLFAMTMRTGSDGKALEAQAAAYGKLVDEVASYATAHAAEASQRGSMANLRNYSQQFLGAAKVVVRKRLDGAEPTAEERAAALAQYNSLVDNFNNH